MSSALGLSALKKACNKWSTGLSKWPSGANTSLLKPWPSRKFVSFPTTVDLSIVFCMFTRGYQSMVRGSSTLMINPGLINRNAQTVQKNWRGSISVAKKTIWKYCLGEPSQLINQALGSSGLAMDHGPESIPIHRHGATADRFDQAPRHQGGTWNVGSPSPGRR